jgi:hypothetical protein
MVEQRPFKALVVGSSPTQPKSDDFRCLVLYIVGQNESGSRRPFSRIPSQDFQQIEKRIFLPIQLEDRKAGCGRSLPIAFRIVAGVQGLVRPFAAEPQSPAINFRIGFVGAELTREEDVREIFRQSQMFQDHSKTSVEVRDDGELEPAMKVGEDFVHLGIRLPDTGLGKMPVDGLEISITVQLPEVGSDSIEDTIHQLAPPAFVVIRPRTDHRGTGWHSLPALGERAVEAGGIEAQADSLRDEGIMMTDAFWQVNERAGRVEKNGRYRVHVTIEGVLAFTGSPTVL